LIFLEDYRPLVAKAQSLKVSSLGRLAASIAHEIRNPLGAISHATQLLQESGDIPESDRRMLELVITNSQRVNDIVESVLQISRREPPRPQDLQLKRWVENYRRRYLDGRSEPGTLHIEYADPRARVRFDPEHLQRILDNLVDNAMRHSAAHTGVPSAEIRIRVDSPRAECMIDVYDEGEGVRAEDLPRLFEPFFTRSSGGTGLGLYLCRELCELNQARISYEPTGDQRSRFQILLTQLAGT
jgi:two-component system sensor histidine kinase PilS (NtrC family)